MTSNALPPSLLVTTLSLRLLNLDSSPLSCNYQSTLIPNSLKASQSRLTTLTPMDFMMPSSPSITQSMIPSKYCLPALQAPLSDGTPPAPTLKPPLSVHLVAETSSSSPLDKLKTSSLPKPVLQLRPPLPSRFHSPLIASLVSQLTTSGMTKLSALTLPMELTPLPAMLLNVC